MVHVDGMEIQCDVLYDQINVIKWYRNLKELKATAVDIVHPLLYTIYTVYRAWNAYNN